jgi:hypothetical protein
MESNFETSYLLTRKRLGSRSPLRPKNPAEAFPIKAGDDLGSCAASLDSAAFRE